MKDHRSSLIVIILLVFTLFSPKASAQSSMTDSQVADYVQRELKAGTSQSQIVIHLMPNGVDI